MPWSRFLPGFDCSGMHSLFWGWTLSWTFSAVGHPLSSGVVLLFVYPPVKTRYCSNRQLKENEYVAVQVFP